ncbi:hypothetical protein DFH27DRAFT_563 [Peziza echinospora]|nr:hypothetical protein DFH27DRAFT_563 [Peziza echinospora]
MQQQRQSTPPQTPPRVAFDPPLFLQRRTAVFDLLTTLNGLPRFSGKLQSLLDVGCGPEGLLLGSLIAPNDSLPLEQVTGIDIDEALWDRDLVESLGPHGPHVGDAGRWRRLGLTLLHGSFESLNLDLISHHDVIVSAEVIEHLDPEPLANYAPVLLGKLKPRVCIVTTPNRDFNDLFSLPFTPEGSCPDTPDKEESDPLLFGQIVDPNNLTRPPPPPATIKSNPHEEAWRSLSPGDVCSSGDRYWRHGVPYGMRHPDHRFEWTRAEFRQWARSAAEEFGYDVTFTGVGGLGNGMCVVGSSGWAIGEALAKGCGYDKTLPEHYDKDRGVLEKASEVWGDCSQIAVFTIREDEEPIMASLIDHQDWSRRNKRAKSTCSPLSPFIFHPPVTEIVHHDFPYDPNEVFPPTYLDVIGLLEKQMYTHLPTLVLDQWSKTPHQLTRERLRRMEVTKDAGAGIHGSDSECDYSWNPELDGDETARKVRKKERRYEKGIQRDIEEAVLGGKRLDLVRVVKVTGAELQSLWDGGDGGKDGLRRLCRFRPEVFRSVLMEGWKATLEAHGRYIGDKAQGGHCEHPQDKEMDSY